MAANHGSGPNDEESIDCGSAPSATLQRKVFVGNISLTIAGHHKLAKFFRKFGKVESAQLVYDRATSEFKKIGFVTFEKESSVEKALNASDEQLTFYSRVLRVKPAEEKRNTALIKQVQMQQRSYDHQEGFNDPVLSSATDEECRINCLNVDCLLKIFSYFSPKTKITCERVCKYWRHVSLSSWRTVTFVVFSALMADESFCSLSDDNVVQVLKRSGKRLTSVDLSSCRGLTDKLPMVICQCVTSLTRLSLANTSAVFTHMVAETLAQHAPYLKALNLANCSGVTDKSLIRLLSLNPFIEELDVSGFQYQGNGRSLLLCKCLRKLNLSHCPLIDGGVLNDLIASSSDTIEELNLSYLKKISAINLTQMCPNLRKLDISFPDSGFCQKGYPLLLDFSGATNLVELIAVGASAFFLSPSNINNLMNNCPNLRKLNLSRNGMLQLWNYCGVRSFVAEMGRKLSVTELDISYSDLGYTVGLDQLNKLPNLERLILSGSESLFSGAEVGMLIEDLPMLKYLDISGIKLREGENLKNSLLRTHASTEDERPQLTLVIGGCELSILADLPSDIRVTIDETNNSVPTLLLPYQRDLMANDTFDWDYDSDGSSDAIGHDIDDAFAAEEWLDDNFDA